MRFHQFWLPLVLLWGLPWGTAFAQWHVSVERRLAERTFPIRVSGLESHGPLGSGRSPAHCNRHDLLFGGPELFGLNWAGPYPGLATNFDPASLHRAESLREFRYFLNPNMVFLLEIRYRDAPAGYLPPDSPWWKRDADGNIEKGWEEGNYRLLDFGSPSFREQVVNQCAAAVNSGVVDGVMLDWWQDDDDRLALIAAIRKRIGNKALNLVNTNQRTAPRITP